MAFDIYQEEIIEHYKKPQNKGVIEHPDMFSHGNNPVCGDDITVYLRVKEGTISDVKFDGRGCAISQATASMLTEKVKGMKLEDVSKLNADDIKEMLHIPLSAVRMKCATLSLNTIHEATARGVIQ